MEANSIEKKNEESDQQNLQKLPDEVLLRIFGFLEVESLLRCSQVSKRIRKICHDQAVWEKCNVQFVKIPIEFIEKILDNGCKHLNLTYCYLIGNPNLKIPTKMKYSSHYSVHEDIDNVSDKLEACILSLKNLSYKMINASQLKSLSLQCCKSSEGIFEELLASCQSLEKLSLKFVDINTNVIKRFSHKNGQTLQALHITYCKSLNLQSIQHIFKNCDKLKVITFGNSDLTKETLDWIVNNMPANIEKISLCSTKVDNEQVRRLVKRCNKINELDLYDTHVSEGVVKHIIEHLQSSLEFLDLGCTIKVTGSINDINFQFAELKLLNIMPGLKVLNIAPLQRIRTATINSRAHWLKMSQQLQKQLPNVTITQSYKRTETDKNVNDKFDSVRQFLMPTKQGGTASKRESSEFSHDSCIKRSKFQYDDVPLGFNQ